MTIHIHQSKSLDGLKTRIDALYADNTTQEISPGDLREVEYYEAELFAVNDMNLMAQDASVALKLGSLDAILHTPADPYGTVAKTLKDILRRLTALENGPAVPPITPAEFTMLVENYSGGFVTVMLGSNTGIRDKAPHRVSFALATAGQTGPSGVAIADVASLRLMTGAVWFDNNGTLGKVVSTAGHVTAADISPTTLASWIEEGAVTITTYGDTDPAHPTLTISQVEIP